METLKFTPKPAEQLATQITQVTADMGESIVPPYLGNDVLNLPIAQLKEKFPYRYGIYLQSLRRLHTGNEKTNAVLSDASRLKAINSLDSYIQSHHSNENGRTLREKQIGVFEDLRDFLDQGNTEGYIKLPTGSGKTVLFTEFVEATNLRTLVVAPTRILIDQTVERFGQFAPDLEVGKIDSYSKEHGMAVTVTTYDSFVKGVEEGTLSPENYELLILDEAHRSLSKKRTAAVKRFDKAIKLGFTATTHYSQDKHLGALLNNEIHSMNLREAVEEGVLAPFSAYIARTEVDLTNIKVTDTGEYDKGDLEKAINIESRNISAVELYEEMFPDRVGVAYCLSIDHATNVSEMFNHKGIKSVVISGRQSKSVQDELMRQYKEGDIQVLCNADILIEGFDEPKASVCLNLRPTLSPVVAEQRAGRVLRLDSENPKKHAYIVDFLDQTSDQRFLPVTFAQIAGGSEIRRTGTNGYDTTPGGDNPRGVDSPDIKISGLVVTTNAEEVMRIVRDILAQKFQPAPEGWVTTYQLGEITGKAPATIRKMIDSYAELQPDWVKDFLNPIGHNVTYISPDLSAKITETFSNMKPAPEGYRTLLTWAKEMGISGGSLKRNIDILVKERPELAEDMGYYLISGNRLYPHYSSRLIDLINEKRGAGKYEQAPQGWKTNKGWAEEIGVSERVMATRISQAFESDPELAGLGKDAFDRLNRVNKHYSPELIRILKEAGLGSIQKAPEGYLTVDALAKSVGISSERASRIIRELAKNNPDLEEQIGTYLTRNGLERTHYSPEMVNLIKSQL